MSDLNIIHFVKISGMIEQHKKLEFENTVKFACEQMTEECVEKNLSVEIFSGRNYYFFTAWSNEVALRQFVQSEEYQLIRTAYDVMGILQKIEIAYHAEIRTIQISH